MAAPTPPPPEPPGALDRTWHRLRHSIGRHVLVVGGLCVGIALLLTAIDGRGFAVKLVYSLCVGTVCTVAVDLVRLAVAWDADRRSRARGLPHAAGFSSWQGAIPGSLLAVALGPTLGLALGDWLTGNRSGSLLELGSTTARITLVLSLLGTVFSLVVLSAMERLHLARAAAEAAQRQAAEHQLRLLQSQLEPHMLFNTLANLRVLIGLDAERAQAMLDHLIAYLRATLGASRLAAHPLATEFERLADYLGLMAVRMGPRLQTELDLPAALRAVPVPPLLLQPLVENAIKHGLEPHVQGGRIVVRARRDGDALVLTVRDTGAGLRAAPGPHNHSIGPIGPTGATAGFGLAQVRERLATLHGDRASLALEPAPDGAGGTLATLRLPCPVATPGSP